MTTIQIKRVYDEAAGTDGTRILVDRMWPRGVSKKAAALDHWLKGLAPSDELRKWFDHDPDRWDEFRKKYCEELAQGSDDLAKLVSLASQGRVTLVYAAKDEEHNNAAALREFLKRRVTSKSQS